MLGSNHRVCPSWASTVIQLQKQCSAKIEALFQSLAPPIATVGDQDVPSPSMLELTTASFEWHVAIPSFERKYHRYAVTFNVAFDSADFKGDWKAAVTDTFTEAFQLMADPRYRVQRGALSKRKFEEFKGRLVRLTARAHRLRRYKYPQPTTSQQAVLQRHRREVICLEGQASGEVGYMASTRSLLTGCSLSMGLLWSLFVFEDCDAQLVSDVLALCSPDNIDTTGGYYS